MAYHFKRKETVSNGVRRLGRERIEHALACLKNEDRVEAIHGARKDIKKVRAVLRLVRPRIGKKKFRRLIGLLREAARQLAAPRDAFVKTEALRNLAMHFKGQLAPDALRHIRAALRKNADHEMQRFVKEGTARTVERILRRVATASRNLRVRGDGWKTLSPGVKAAYRRGRRAYRVVQHEPSSENMHAWRKRAKDLWYHVRLLQPIWPEEMDAMAGELDTLAKNLGEDHDLFVLQQTLDEEQIGHDHKRERATLTALIERRQTELRAAALALGARFYAEKPAVFGARLAEYWDTWRHEKKSGDTRKVRR